MTFEPTRIEHLVDEIEVDGKLEQSYNYIIYHFKADYGYISAQAYLDEIDEISINGPFRDEENWKIIENKELMDQVITYCKARYAVVKRNGPKGYKAV